MIPDDVAAVRQLLSQLPAGEPDAARAVGIRERCRTELVRRADRAGRCQSAHHRALRAPAIAALAEPVIVGAFCLLYLFGVIVMALHSEGIL